MDWFLYDRDLRHERGNEKIIFTKKLEFHSSHRLAKLKLFDLLLV